jgi:predicted ATPase/class 3 adenylate cyclase
MPHLPTGTVTFFFTDIEGSTRLWEQHPEAMRAALTRHDALAAALVEAHAGTLVRSRGEGDSLFAVFPGATDALAAALAFQQALAAERWPAEVSLRVRIALHTGEADLRDDSYYGSEVNRCARLRAVAHGGQVLLSRTTFDLVRDTLPEGAGLRDLGEHRLRDLARPEHVFQLLHPTLPADFPPLNTLDARSTNLPQQVTSFIGREREMEEVKELLGTTRLLTITGTGGTGKTRLAFRVAGDLVPEYPDGVWSVELAPLADPGLVPAAVALAVGVREERDRPLTETLVSVLKPKRLLLVLDNCEHLLAACAGLADTLLRSCPAVRMLATSREGLNVPGETSYRLRTLSAPDPRQLPSTPDGLIQYEAVRLFAARASAVVPTFTVSGENAPSIAQICCRLDGIPLALELAAARVKALSPEKINERLDDRFRLLTGGARTALPRQQTLRALIDWSYDLLSPAERALLRRLSVFAGSWTLEAAEAVCSDFGFRILDFGLGDDPSAIQNPKSEIQNTDVLDLLTALIEKSLVVYEGEKGERYRLLETVRQYARDRVVESGEEGLLQRRHLEFFVGFAERAEPELIRADQTEWLDRLEEEHDNLRAALACCLGQLPVTSGQLSVRSNTEDRQLTTDNCQLATGLRLAGTLWWFWLVRSYFTEGREWLERAAARGAAAPASARATVLHGAAYLARVQGQLDHAKALAGQALKLWQELGDKQGIAWALYTLGFVAHAEDNDEQAKQWSEESLALWRELGDRRGIAFALEQLGVMAVGRGDYERGKALATESLALYREVEDKRSIALSQWLLAWTAMTQKEYRSARAYFDQILPLLRELKDKRNAAWVLAWHGRVAGHLGDHTRAARLLGAAAVLCEAHSVSWLGGERGEIERSRAAARAALGEAAFTAAWAEGRAMSLEEASSVALEGSDA